MPMNFPTPTFIGQQWSNGTTIYQWDGVTWNIVPQMMPVYISDTPPLNPAVGQEWWRSTNGQLYVWYDDGNSKQWVQSAGAAGSPGIWEPIPSGNQRGLLIGNATNIFLLQNLGAYRDIRMYFKAQTVQAPADQPFYMQFSSDNGATWLGTATEYVEQLTENQGTSFGGSSTSSSVLAITGTFAAAHAAHEIWLSNFNFSGNVAWFNIDGSGFRSASGGVIKNFVCGYGSISPLNALKIFGPPSFDYHVIAEGVRG